MINEKETESLKNEFSDSEPISDLFSEINKPAEIHEKEPDEMPETDIFSESESEDPEPEKADTPETIKQTARMVCFVADKMNAGICSAISGELPELFKLTESEKKEFNEITARYFESVNYTPSPGYVFAAAVAAIFGGKWLKAVKIRNENKKKESGKWKPPIKKQSEIKPIPNKFSPPKKESTFNVSAEPEPQSEPSEPEPDTDKTKDIIRKRFEVDKNGFYTFHYPFGTKKAEYLKKSDRIEKAPPEILQMIESGFTNKEIYKMIHETQ